MLSVGLGSSSWALGIAVALFTLFSGFAALFMAVLYIRNGQKFNYITILAVAICLDKFNSFAQQLYSLFNFQEIQWKAYWMAVEYFNCRGEESLPLFSAPDAVASIFLHAQNFLLNMQGLLFFYWSIILFSSAWALSPVWWKNKWVIIGTKVSCFVVPALLLGILWIPSIRASDLANLMIMNVLILINMGMSSVFLILTLIYIISVHRETRGATEVRLSKTYDGVIEFRKRAPLLEKGFPKGGKLKPSGALSLNSDGWIIGRIALAFVMVEGLQIYVIVMQIFFLNRWAHFKTEWQQGLSAPAIDQAEEFANICSPIPSSFTGFLFLLVFGTTAESRAQANALFQDVWGFITCRPKDRKRNQAKSAAARFWDVEREHNKLRKRALLTHPSSIYSVPTSRDSSSVSSFFSSPHTASSGSTPVSPLERVVSNASSSKSGKIPASGLRILTEPSAFSIPVEYSKSKDNDAWAASGNGQMAYEQAPTWLPEPASGKSQFSPNVGRTSPNGSATVSQRQMAPYGVMSPASSGRGKSDWNLEFVPVMSPMPAARVVGPDEIKRFSSGSGPSGGGAWVVSPGSANRGPPVGGAL